jgi:hypothetical protein
MPTFSQQMKKNPKMAAIKLKNQIRRGKRKSSVTVKDGDSWFKIAGSQFADMFGEGPSAVVAAQRLAGELAKANPHIKNLQPGQTVKLPWSQASRAAKKGNKGAYLSKAMMGQTTAPAVQSGGNAAGVPDAGPTVLATPTTEVSQRDEQLSLYKKNLARQQQQSQQAETYMSMQGYSPAAIQTQAGLEYKWNPQSQKGYNPQKVQGGVSYADLVSQNFLVAQERKAQQSTLNQMNTSVIEGMNVSSIPEGPGAIAPPPPPPAPSPPPPLPYSPANPDITEKNKPPKPAPSVPPLTTIYDALGIKGPRAPDGPPPAPGVVMTPVYPGETVWDAVARNRREGNLDPLNYSTQLKYYMSQGQSPLVLPMEVLELWAREEGSEINYSVLAQKGYTYDPVLQSWVLTNAPTNRVVEQEPRGNPYYNPYATPPKSRNPWTQPGLPNAPKPTAGGRRMVGAGSGYGGGYDPYLSANLTSWRIS